MDAVSLVLAVAGTLDLCIDYGNRLVVALREIKRLSKDIEEIALIIEGIWLKTEVQVTLLRRLWGSSSLSEPVLQQHYANAMNHLYEKIYSAFDGLEKTNNRHLSSTKALERAKTLYLARYLKQVVSDLEKWQRLFDPSWYLITLLSTPKVDEALQKQERAPPVSRITRIRTAIHDVASQKSDSSDPIFKPKSSVAQHRDRISNTNSFISRYEGHRILLDRTNYSAKLFSQVIQGYVRDIARMLTNVDPASFGLLKCIGVVEAPPSDSDIQSSQTLQYEFIFEIPDCLNSPQTLRELLLAKPKVSLTLRMQLAKQLARSIMFVHTTGFVHKGIRPETILVFDDEKTGKAASFLIGFERIRQAQGHTDKMEDLEWRKNLYRHPVRQGQWSEEMYVMQHDVYSLGVCLLEIALWHSFVCFEGDESPQPWSELNIKDAISDKDARRGGFAVKKELVGLAKDRLPCLVGDRYTQLVVSCLRCLDADDADNVFNTPDIGVTDRDGLVVGVRYIENVLLKAEELLV